MRLQCIFVLIMCVAFYTAITIHLFHKHYGEKQTRIREPPPPSKLLLLVSQPRSGSTYLGKLLSTGMRSVYFYEPLHNLDQVFRLDINFATNTSTRQRYDEFAAEYLRRMLQCNFEDRNKWRRINKSIFKTLNKLKTRSCRESVDPHCNDFIFNSYHMQKECHTYDLMVKLLEMRVPFRAVPTLRNLVSKRTDYKIVYLMRDPRAAFWSLLRTGWVAKSAANETFRRYVPIRCAEMYKTVMDVQNMTNVVILRYEDLIVKPHKAMQQVYKYLKDEATVFKIKSLLESTNKCYLPNLNSNTTFDHNSKDFSEFMRKRRENYECFGINKWRMRANKLFVKIVEDSCTDIMRVMGYRKVEGKLSLLKEFSHSLIDANYMYNTI